MVMLRRGREWFEHKLTGSSRKILQCEECGGDVKVGLECERVQCALCLMYDADVWAVATDFWKGRPPHHLRKAAARFEKRMAGDLKVREQIMALRSNGK